jgi:exopolysaccharide biosynthesis polyprenyl glycosylphosphotransferase
VSHRQAHNAHPNRVKGRASDNHQRYRDSRSTAAARAPSPSALQGYRKIGVGLALSDAACVILALLVAYYLRQHDRPMPIGESAAVVIAPLLWVSVFHAFGLYAPQHLSAPEELRRIFGATGVGIVLLVMVSYWSKSSFSRTWMGLTWMLALLAEMVTRRAWRWYAHRLKLNGRLALRTLIVGTSREAARLAEILGAPASGFAPLGYVRASEPTITADTLPVLGDLAELHALIREHAVDCLFVASSASTFDDLFRAAKAAREESVEIRISANVPQILTSRLAIQKVGSAIALSLRPVRMTGHQRMLKRAFDLVVASVGLLVACPLLVIIGIAVRLTSPGPVFFHQERVTKDGRVFRVHKFRTMRTAVDVSLDTTVPFFKLEADPRLTRIGAFLRRFSLDELPQFWNVLAGEMSIVGPRALAADQVATDPELLSPRHAVPAGITGWWQVNGRSRVAPEEALRLDLFYIENWSLTLDLYILLKTFGAVVSRRGAY